MKVTIDTSELDAAANRWARRSRSIQKDAEAVIRSHSVDYVSDAAGETPVRSGLLAAGWRVVRTDGGSALVNTARYAGFVLSGELSARVRARVVARIPSMQPELVRRQTHGSS